MTTVSISWSGGRGTVDPQEVTAGRNEQVAFGASGSGVTVSFPSTDLFGVSQIHIDEDDTEVLTVEGDAQLGKYPCPVRCDKERQEPPTTPPIDFIIE
jgi:hypothetical protein